MPKEIKDAKERDKSSVEGALIRELAAVLNETGLTEIEVEKEGLRLRVARQVTVSAAVHHAASAALSPSVPPASATAAAAPAVIAAHPGTVKSPMVGTVYRAPGPGAAPFVESGTKVAQGQTILIIEAMKTMNHIQAPKSGTVTTVFVDDKQPVEFGEPLVVIE